jgi:hypothetical protein
MNQQRRAEIIKTIKRHLERTPGIRLPCGCVLTVCPGCDHDTLVINVDRDCELGGGRHPLHALLVDEAGRYWKTLEARVLRDTTEEVGERGKAR